MAYKVVKGDSLSKIAKANGTTVKELMRLNPGIKNANMIKIGQSLALPSDSAPAAEPAAAPTPMPTPAAQAPATADPNASSLGLTVNPDGTIAYKQRSDADILSQVDAEISGTYAAQKANADTAYNQALQNYNVQNQEIGKKYDTGLTNVSDYFKTQAQQADNKMLGQGIARSSIAKNVQDRVGADKTKALTDLGSERDSALNTLSTNKNSAYQQYISGLNTLSAEEQAKKIARANELRAAEQQKYYDSLKNNTALAAK